MMSPREILAFWFSDHARTHWFRSTPSFDAEVRAQLFDSFEKAAGGTLTAWQTAPEGCVALVILFDQVPRNIFRGTARAFATDAQALAVTRLALKNGFDNAVNEEQRLFLFLPLEHAEDAAAQDQCVRLFAQKTRSAEWLDYAEKHRKIIQRFGRFPHRNKILGRVSTPEEEAFLREPGSSF